MRSLSHRSFDAGSSSADARKDPDMTTLTTPRSITTTTPSLLLAGAVSGPLWACVSLVQAAVRPGFNLTRHPLSALSDGDLGWVQIANFVVAGVLLILGASGLRRALAGTVGGQWTPRLVRIAGFGLVAAGAFVMDPADGFPVGTPAGMPATMTWHSYGHMVAGSVSFIALIAACYVLGRHFRRAGDRGRAIASRVAGTALLVGNGWAMTGGRAGSLTLAIGAITAMLWVSFVAALLRRRSA
jgi:hypothetical protein